MYVCIYLLFVCFLSLAAAFLANKDEYINQSKLTFPRGGQPVWHASASLLYDVRATRTGALTTGMPCAAVLHRTAISLKRTDHQKWHQFFSLAQLSRNSQV